MSGEQQLSGDTVMKPGTLLILILLVSLLMVGCIDQSGVGTGWVRTWGGPYDDYCFNFAFDSDGNIYTVNYFSGTAEWDNGEKIECNTQSGNYCYFLAKYDDMGNLVWSQRLHYGSSSLDIVVEPTGDIFLSGGFGGTEDFDPGPGVTERTPETYSDNFLARFDPDGNFLQVTTPTAGRELSADPMGNLLVGGTNIVEKLALGGTVLWSCAISSSCRELVGDASGNVFYTGTSYKPAPDQRIWRNGYRTAFLGCIEPDGSLLWEKTWGVVDPGSYIEDLNSDQVPSTTVSDIALDSEGNIYVVGFFSGEVDFDPGPGKHLLISSVPGGNYRDSYISKFDSSGNLLNVIILPSSRDAYLSLDINSADQILVAGRFDGTVDFDPGPGIVERTAVNTRPYPRGAGFPDCYLCCYNTEFEPQWVRTWGSDKEDIIKDVTFGPYDCIYIVGSFTATVDFNPGPDEDLRTSVMHEDGNWHTKDVYLLKLLPDGSW